MGVLLLRKLKDQLIKRRGLFRNKQKVKIKYLINFIIFFSQIKRYILNDPGLLLEMLKTYDKDNINSSYI